MSTQEVSEMQVAILVVVPLVAARTTIALAVSMEIDIDLPLQPLSQAGLLRVCPNFS
jgi:hypothetical protein